MITQPDFYFDMDLLAKQVREKRGDRSLREIEAELGIPIATLSRIENGKKPDYHNFTMICTWLGIHPGHYFKDNPQTPDNTLKTQLRAVKNMSPETACAFADLIRAAYEQILEDANEDDIA